jgi:hypothetical protein
MAPGITTGATMTTPDIYFDHDRYSRIVTALANLQPCPFAGRVTEDQIKRTLGEAGDIWPVEIRGDVVLAGLEDTEKQRQSNQHRYA